VEALSIFDLQFNVHSTFFLSAEAYGG